ncbi:MAG: type 4a pilus biogenesis protein PilO [Candidatus Omnitrophica bacterium]|nr:type 4a pilus biogenesis protein PilO [Candidatus Omnitrophota bacterium]
MVVLKQREKVIMVFAGIMVLIFLWIQFILRPIADYNETLNIAIASKSVKLRESKNILDGSSQQLAVKSFLQQFTPKGPVQEDMSRLIKEVESAAINSGLKVQETKPQPLSQNGTWAELKVNLSFEGRWSDVVRFMYQLEKSVQPLFVNEMSLETSLPQQATIRGRFEIGRVLVTR